MKNSMQQYSINDPASSIHPLCIQNSHWLQVKVCENGMQVGQYINKDIAICWEIWVFKTQPRTLTEYWKAGGQPLWVLT